MPNKRKRKAANASAPPFASNFMRVHPEFADWCNKQAEKQTRAAGRRVSLIEVTKAVALYLTTRDAWLEVQHASIPTTGVESNGNESA